MNFIYWLYSYGAHTIDICAFHDLSSFPPKASGRIILAETIEEISAGTNLTKTFHNDDMSNLVNRYEQTGSALKYIYQRFKISFYVSSFF